MLWAAFINPVVHQSSRYRLAPIVWLQQWAFNSSSMYKANIVAKVAMYAYGSRYEG